jgi:hypothetical protein
MRQQIEARLISLRGEYDKGQKELRQLELQLTSLHQS